MLQVPQVLPSRVVLGPHTEDARAHPPAAQWCRHSPRGAVHSTVLRDAEGEAARLQVRLRQGQEELDSVVLPRVQGVRAMLRPLQRGQAAVLRLLRSRLSHLLPHEAAAKATRRYAVEQWSPRIRRVVACKQR